MSERFPFPDYPTGWYRVAFSDEVRAGDLTPITFFGQELILFRLDDGGVHVMEAHCPHLGAHLGMGGCIKDGQAVCPFHGWHFGPDGTNVEIPYRDEVNRKARLRTFETGDWSGLVMVWFDEAGAPPTWDLPELPEYRDPRFLWHTPEGSRWRIRTHPQEILENAVDIAHFQFVHGVSSFGALSLVEEGPMLRSRAELALTTAQGPVQGAVVNELWGLEVHRTSPSLAIGEGAILTFRRWAAQFYA